MTKFSKHAMSPSDDSSGRRFGKRGKRIIKRVCPDCWGSGYQVVDHRKSTCSKCHGTGQIEEEIEVRD
jgi:DnaJ-class molecular chaperone